LVNAKNEKTTILGSEIDELQESRLSLMPEDLYKQLKPQELRDLFAYLESAGKPPF
jgi:cytochrome c1